MDATGRVFMFEQGELEMIFVPVLLVLLDSLSGSQAQSE